MKRLNGVWSGSRVAALGIITASVGLTIAPSSALAQAAYGSYVGVGANMGVSESGNGESTSPGGTISVRYKFLEAPFSLRTQALIGSNQAIVPTISYDFPLSWQTDAYLGAGVVFAAGDEPTPVGNKTGLALQPGIDYALPNSKAVIFGNAIIAPNAYQDGGGTAISVQGGIGWRF
ncbi:MAG: porin family protein [Cyanosarcina radialis HA8281-LM2]|jgi:hypothetical protein|nr:porin family protein [Cyanosarcina radialis HA8281-LM2]